MGQQNLTFVEKHVEKVVVGVGAAIGLASMALMVKWAAGTPDFPPGALVEKANREMQGIKANPGPEALVVPAWEKAKVKLELAAALPQVAGLNPLYVVGPAPQSAYPKLDLPGERTKIVETKPREKLSIKEMPPLPTPSKPALVVAAGRGGKAVGEGKYDRQDEFTGGVHLRFTYNQQQLYEGWWVLYTYCVAKQEEIRRRTFRPTTDYKAAAVEFFRKWNVVTVGIETQMQRFIPGVGWEKDKDGKDLWLDLERPYGIANDEGLMYEIRSAKLPKRDQRKDDSELRAKRDRLNEIAGKVLYDVEWPVPPGPPAVGLVSGAAKLQFFDARGVPLKDKNWPQRPEIRVVNPVAVGPGVGPAVPDKKEKDKEKPKGGVFGEDPEEKKVDKTDPGTKKGSVDEDGALNRDAAVGRKMQTLGGESERNLASLVLGGKFGNALNPGEVYRFRVRYAVMNPAFLWDMADNELETTVHFQSAWSEAGPPAFMPELHRIFVNGVQFAAGNRLPQLQVWRWWEGDWYNTKNMSFTHGDIVRSNPARKELDLKGGRNLPVGGGTGQISLETAHALMDSGSAVVDVQELPAMNRKPLPQSPPFKPHPGTTMRVTAQDPRGNLIHHFQAYDKDDQNKWRAAMGVR